MSDSKVENFRIENIRLTNRFYDCGTVPSFIHRTGPTAACYRGNVIAQRGCYRVSCRGLVSPASSVGLAHNTSAEAANDSVYPAPGVGRVDKVLYQRGAISADYRLEAVIEFLGEFVFPDRYLNSMKYMRIYFKGRLGMK